MNVYVVDVEDAHRRWRYVVIAPKADEADRIAVEHHGNPPEVSSTVGRLGKYEPGHSGAQLVSITWPIVAIEGIDL